MKKKVFLSAVFITLALATFCQNAKRSFRAGEDFVENLRYEDAIVQFTSAIGLDPSNADYYEARGKAYEMLNKFDEAYADFEKAMVFEPKEVDLMVDLARVCNKMGKYDDALALLNKASGMEKRNAAIYPEKVNTLLGLRMFEQALKVSDTAILLKDDALHYYYRGICFINLNNDAFGKRELEKSISKDKKLVEPRLELARLLVRNNDPNGAMEQISDILENDDRNTEAYVVRSTIYKKMIDYPSAINDLSKTILIDPENPEYYLLRGQTYQEFNQHTNAINDFTKYITLRSDNPDAYFARARSYEEIMDFEKAMEDYRKITALSEFDMRARKMLKEAQTRLYELNRETVPPDIAIISPEIKDNVIQVKGNLNSITISGKITERSALDTLLINNDKVMFGEKTNGENDFIANVDITGTDEIKIFARDEYNNEKSLNLKIFRTEINPPKVTISVPYSDGAEVYLDAILPRLFLEGKVEDESPIKSIQVAGSFAAFDPNEKNPSFNLSFDIANINKFPVIVEDIYGNVLQKEFAINRQAALLAANNPMGKTWVVFIENSSYETFASLDGPIKDVSAIQRALDNYQVHRFILKKDMTKEEMEKYFTIELRDDLKLNQVKSLLIWYAGHGKFINEVGYWIPVDAERDNEFSYFNINTLKAGMQAYSSVVHTLVVTDACESGPSFYQAMRSSNEEPTCDDYQATAFKSAQVFSSAGYELAVDQSQFTQTFANTLINNQNACIPIETIVRTVSAAVTNTNQQKPKFGKIAGLQDENGTFFFIAK